MTTASSPGTTTKAEVLLRLSMAGISSIVPVGLTLTHRDWNSDKIGCISRIDELFGSVAPLIVRSNASTEDQLGQSQAGKFLSVPNVVTKNALHEAINLVFRSYGENAENESVLVQEYFSSFDIVGVAFFPDPNTGSGYTAVNYAIGGETDAITSGQGNYSTWYYGPDKSGIKAPEPQLALVLGALDEIIETLKWPTIDIEFGIREGKFYLFQCRPLAGLKSLTSKKKLKSLIKHAQAQFTSATLPIDGILGSKTCLGVMPDWNPAEIIGVRPRPLALSLYQNLVTDGIWARRRSDYGYRKVPTSPLLRIINGIPYVDVRKSFNSLLPKGIDESLSSHIVDTCIDLLARRPELHDKVEFQIIPTCYQPGIHLLLSERFTSQLTSLQQKKYAEGLQVLTIGILRNYCAFASEEERELHRLREASASATNLEEKHLITARLLFDACAKFGTPSFVGQARRAFIAVSMLRSFEKHGVASPGFSNAVLGGIATVASSFQKDRTEMSYEQLMVKYGHLRPGTYDIRAPRYDEMSSEIFASDHGLDMGHGERQAAVSDRDLNSIDRWLRDEGFGLGSSEFLEFCRGSIVDREKGKFEFTRALSDGLRAVVNFGNVNGIGRDGLSYLTQEDITNLLSTPDRDHAKVCRERIDNRQRINLSFSSFVPPTIVFSHEDFNSFILSEGHPNFIGESVITGDVVDLTNSADLDGKIVCIEGADPGFDWIFGAGVKGIITMYGGANSHMAIRAHELSLTAVIGAGPVLYRRWAGYARMLIDPYGRRVSRIS